MSIDKLFIRVSTDPAFGAGHLARVRALRPFFNCSVYWFVDPKTSTKLDAFVKSGDQVIEEQSNNSTQQLQNYYYQISPNLIICDSYHISFTELTFPNILTVFFCDDQVKDIAPNVKLVNCQPSAKCKSNNLCGPKYTPLNVYSSKQKKKCFQNLSKPINCLINFGAVDSGNYTGLSLKAILSDKKFRTLIKPICLIGRYFRHIDMVEKLLSHFPNSEILEGYDTVINVPLSCDIAIGAPGVSHAERLYLGIPTVLIAQNVYHQKLCEDWQAEGCAIVATSSSKDIVNQLWNLIANDFNLARQISERGQSLVDGKGAERIAHSILAKFNY